jgi:transcriptional regulator with XRE-family HTH domain
MLNTGEFSVSPKEIHTRRLDLGLSVFDLAKELGMKTQELLDIEAGRRPAPDRRLIEKALARVSDRAKGSEPEK